MNSNGTYTRYIISTLTVLSYCTYTSCVFFHKRSPGLLLSLLVMGGLGEDGVGGEMGELSGDGVCQEMGELSEDGV